MRVECDSDGPTSKIASPMNRPAGPVASMGLPSTADFQIIPTEVMAKSIFTRSCTIAQFRTAHYSCQLVDSSPPGLFQK